MDNAQRCQRAAAYAAESNGHSPDIAQAVLE